jgi:ribosomal-protein-alanine N-acetyltransferase
MEIAASLESAPQWPRSAYLDALDPEAASRRIALVIESSRTGLVAGFAVASLLPPEAELELIAIDLSAQRHGFASQLFARMAEELRAALVKEVVLEVRASNHPALALYRRLGFVESGRRKDYYQIPVEDALLMRLGL